MLTTLEKDLLISTALCVESVLADEAPHQKDNLLSEMQSHLSKVLDNDVDNFPHRYVVGLLFNATLDRVVLIRKLRPDWQRGKLNGVGGRINEGESAGDAMTREFKEEANVWVTDWRCFAQYYHHSLQSIVTFFSAYNTQALEHVETVTDERITTRTVEMVLRDPTLIPNLRYLIPMAVTPDLDVVTIHDRSPRP